MEMPAPTLLPQMMTLSDVVDKFAKSRMAMAQFERQQAADAAKEEYYQGRNAIADKRQASQDAFNRAKLGQDETKRATGLIGKGLDPGIGVVQGPDGSPIYVEWRYKKPKRVAAPQGAAPQEAAPEQPIVPQLTMPEQSLGPKPEPMVPQLRAPQSAYTMPTEVQAFQGTMQPDVRVPTLPSPVPPTARNTVFLDADNEGDTRALMGPGDSETRQLPIDAFPPGAREGQRFDAADVNLRGGKGNPFAEPVDPASMPQVERQQVPGGRLNLDQPQMTATRPTEVRAFKGDMPPDDDEDEYWWADVGGRIVKIRPGDARAAREEEARAAVTQLLAAVNDPNTPPERRASLMAVVPALAGGLSQAMQLEQAKQAGSQENLGTQRDMQGERLASNEKIAAERNATTLKAAEMRRKKGGGAGGFVAKSSGEGSAFSRLKPTEQYRVNSAVNTTIGLFDREMNWNKLIGVGFDRLDLALRNITAKGELGGTQQMEAMMNFFGYIRGGVPAKNETDEWRSITSNIWTKLDSLGQLVGVKGLGSRWTGSKEDEAAFAAGVKQLPTAQRQSLEQAIRESKAAIEGFAIKNIAAQAEGFKSASTAMHERAQDAFNSKLRFIGMQPRQWFSDSPLIPDFQSGGQPTGQSGAAPAGQASPALEAGLKQLIEMKKRQQGGGK